MIVVLQKIQTNNIDSQTDKVLEDKFKSDTNLEASPSKSDYCTLPLVL